MTRALAKKPETSTVLLEAAKTVLRQKGYAGLSTREVAALAGMPLSQIHYHFGSKHGMVLALFEYLNAQLLDRQDALFHDASLALSEQWDRACDYLDDDIACDLCRVGEHLAGNFVAHRTPTPRRRSSRWLSRLIVYDTVQNMSAANASVSPIRPWPRNCSCCVIAWLTLSNSNRLIATPARAVSLNSEITCPI